MHECPYKGFTHKNKQIAVTKTICLFTCDSDIVNIYTFTQPVANVQTCCIKDFLHANLKKKKKCV